VFTMDENIEQRLFHDVPTELAIDRSMIPLPSEVSEGVQHVYAAIHSKFQGTTRKVPHVPLPCDAFILSLQ
jgi:glyceraldehyde-3-phosphate dehydrogenase/erythrose-4-phosphate dehydrogenase